jgi:hypothetical protein
MEDIGRKCHVWLWSQQGGKAVHIVNGQPLSNPNGQIKLWLSDFFRKDAGLLDDMVRPITPT